MYEVRTDTNNRASSGDIEYRWTTRFKTKKEADEHAKELEKVLQNPNSIVSVHKVKK